MGQEPGVSNHAVVWADRHRFDMPASVEHLDRLRESEPMVAEHASKVRCLIDRGEIRKEDAARPEGLRRMRNDIPWLGEIENDAVKP